MKIIRPDQSRIGKFMTVPIVFGVVACAICILALGLDLAALIACIIILAVVVLPFAALILPTFLRERIIIEDFTSTFWLVFLWFKFKKVVQIADIVRIEEGYRDNRSSGPRVIRIMIDGENGKDAVMLSEMKYKRLDILDMIHTYVQRNPKIQVSLIEQS
jgi:hypothetical protein